jgi:hypothetical protein
LGDVESEGHALSDSGLVVLQDLLGRQGAIVDRGETDLPHPGAIFRDLVAHHQAMIGIPVPEPSGWNRVDVVGPATIDEDIPSVELVVGHHDVLERRLRVLVDVVGHHVRATIIIRLGQEGAIAQVVLVGDLAQHEVARARVARVADDPRGTLLGGVAIRDPGLERVGLRAGAHVRDPFVELATGLGGRDRAALGNVDAVGRHQLGPLECEIHRGRHAARVEGGIARSFLEVPACDDALIEALAALFLDAVGDLLHVAGEVRDVDTRGRTTARRLDRGLPGEDLGQHLACVAHAIRPAKVEIRRQAAHEPRLRGVREVHLLVVHHRRPGRCGIRVRDLGRTGTARAMAVVTVGAQQRIDGRLEGRDLLRDGEALRQTGREGVGHDRGIGPGAAVFAAGEGRQRDQGDHQPCRDRAAASRGGRPVDLLSREVEGIHRMIPRSLASPVRTRRAGVASTTHDRAQSSMQCSATAANTPLIR